MIKKKIGNNGFSYPMPVTLIGAEVEGKANFLTAAWITRVDYRPPMIGVALGTHHTNKGIELHKQFSVNIPSVTMIKTVDYCGIVSGKKIDKSSLYTTFKGELLHAPMIEQCPLAMECRLVKTFPLGADTFYVGEIIGVYTDDSYLTDGNPDVEKIQPIVLTMPDNKYWSIGRKIGTAWNIGQDLKK
ncbi:MAG: flavin reductase family protein [Endomicrobiales bacterium]|jgi:flavin reductase (DIM6/NTAB) family NADH-FMN oxidoreductase RutF